jgi:hypothetical protein
VHGREDCAGRADRGCRDEEGCREFVATCSISEARRAAITELGRRREGSAVIRAVRVGVDCSRGNNYRTRGSKRRRIGGRGRRDFGEERRRRLDCGPTTKLRPRSRCSSWASSITKQVACILEEE